MAQGSAGPIPAHAGLEARIHRGFISGFGGFERGERRRRARPVVRQHIGRPDQARAFDQVHLLQPKPR
jgi:hypothetical protein